MRVTPKVKAAIRRLLPKSRFGRGVSVLAGVHRGRADHCGRRFAYSDATLQCGGFAFNGRIRRAPWGPGRYRKLAVPTFHPVARERRRICQRHCAQLPCSLRYDCFQRIDSNCFKGRRLRQSSTHPTWNPTSARIHRVYCLGMVARFAVFRKYARLWGRCSLGCV